MSELVECRYSTFVLRLSRFVWMFTCIVKSSKLLLASVVQLIKKGMELYELGIIFFFRGVSVLVYSLRCCCLHIESGFFFQRDL